jgi:hypothetical protein
VKELALMWIETKIPAFSRDKGANREEPILPEN